MDTATRVFSVRDLTPGDSDAAGRAADAGESGESGGDGSEGAAASESGESRNGGSRAGGAKDAEASAPGGGDSEGGSRVGAGDSEGGSQVGAGDSDADEDSEGGAADSGDVSAEGANASDGDEVTGGDPGAVQGDGLGDARLRAAVAAWVRSGDGTDSSGDSGDSDDSEGATDAGDAAETAEEAAGAAVTAVGTTEAAGADGAAGEPEAEIPAAVEGRAEEAGGRTEAESGTDGAVDGGDAEGADASQGAADAESGGTGTAAEAGRVVDEDAVAGADGPEDAADAATADSATEDTTDTTTDDTTDGEAEGAADESVPVDGEAADAADAADAVDRAAPADDEPSDAAPAGGDEPADGKPAAAGGDSAHVSEEPTAAPDEPAAADGEDPPQGPPAPGDESGTGGRGGRGGVDQPTAVFKRPKPQVDQPTTMLKLGDVKADPERTSKFVALKPLDEPATKKPRPAPAEATAAVPQVGPERTTQQPLPPKPPLDLLAELTNTPRPPETPVRTIVRRVKIWTPLVLLLAVVFAIVQAVRPLPTPTLALTAEDSYTFEGSSTALPWPSEGQGRLDVNGIGTMGTFGKQTPVAIGSVAKAMTAYIVLKDHPLKSGQDGPKITVDALAEKEAGYYKDGESTLTTVKEGDVLTEKEALSAIMIPSANNIARLLARWDAGSEAAFIKKMNDTAKELGMTGTTYTDASGLKETTVSTASDQVKLGNELVKIPALIDITKLPSWVDPSGKKWDNYNRLVPYNGAIGIKTGTTTKAGGNLLFAATKEVGGETVTVVGAILGQHTAPIIDTVNAVSKTAMLAAQDALKSAKILKKGEVVGYVDDKLGGHTPIVVTKDVAAVGWSGLKVKLSFDADDVPHTAKAGTQVGTLTVGDGSSGAVKVPVALEKDLTEPGFTAKLKRLG
ncbi:D-alanyl-D-alanine carboxypeptidase [Streptomyces sp. CA-249302]|uniref:D-alanyl-D-alanine carboxypeptidase n=1 Tax=Streptomyces sp. CA-249302 TaxID=3240058 RepID=UPI003D8F74BB